MSVPGVYVDVDVDVDVEVDVVVSVVVSGAHSLSPEMRFFNVLRP